MARTFILAIALLCGGCTARLHYDYFEPSGLDSVISVPPQAPKNVAILALDGCDLRVQSQVTTENLIVVMLRLNLPPGTHTVFSGNQAKLHAGVTEEELPLSWTEWTIVDGVGMLSKIAFDAPLKPRSFVKSPTRKGVEDTGNYEARITLPSRYSNCREFALEIPGAGGGSPIRMTFVRKTADYRVYVQLQ